MQSQLPTFEQFMKQRSAVAQAYVTGDAGPLSDISTPNDPATFFSPGGGCLQGATQVLEANRRGAEQFHAGGNTRLEILHMACSADLGYWVGLQHAQVRMAAKELVPMTLRITEIFRRENGEWKLVHRHADPLATPTARGNA